MPGDSEPITIYKYGYYRWYAGMFGNINKGSHSLQYIPGCEDLDHPQKCLADKPWMAAQYRIMASYGLGQVVYWTRTEDMRNNIPPEQLYDPEIGSEESAKELSNWRCMDIPTLGMRSYWDEWNAPLADYNGDWDYADKIKTREPDVQPQAIVGSTTNPINGFDIINIVLPSDQFNCGGGSEITPIVNYPENTNRMQSSMFNISLTGQGKMFPLSGSTQKKILAEYDFNFGDNTYRVESVYWENTDLPGIGIGAVRVYSDQSKNLLLWQSPQIKWVLPYSSKITAKTGYNGKSVLLSEWQIGLHSFRYFPIVYDGSEFHVLPVFNNVGDEEKGFFSDGGGIFPYTDGSIVAGRRTYEDLGENKYYVYRFDGSKYILERILLPNAFDDTTPPITTASIDPQPNQEGWWNSPVILNLNGQDDREMLIVKMFINGEEDASFYSPLENISLPFSEGIWQIGYQSVDRRGNTEPRQDLEIKIDQTPPATTIKINGKTDIMEYYNTSATIELQSIDPVLMDESEGSGVKTIEYELDSDNDWTLYQGPFAIEGGGRHIIRYRAIDLAGNVEESREQTIFIDRDAPITQAKINEPDNLNGWYYGGAIVQLSAKDPDLLDGTPGSGLARIEFRLTSSDEWQVYTGPVEVHETGHYWIEYRAMDQAGNVEESKVLEIPLDADAPISSANILSQPDSNGRYPSGTQVELTAEDPRLSDGNDGSGVDRIEYSLDSENNWMRYGDRITLQDIGSLTIYYHAIDWAGNVEQTRSLQLDIAATDTDPPVLEISADPLQLWPPNNKMVPVRIFGTVFDTGSGVKSIHIEVIDEYGTCQPTVTDIGPEGIVDGNWERTIQLEASRKGNDKDGRKYTIRVTVTDNAGNVTTKEIAVIVPHDQGNK